MKKAIISTICVAFAAVRALHRKTFSSKRGQAEQVARDQEAERLDRIRNPRNYRPNQEDLN